MRRSVSIGLRAHLSTVGYGSDDGSRGKRFCSWRNLTAVTPFLSIPQQKNCIDIHISYRIDLPKTSMLPSNTILAWRYRWNYWYSSWTTKNIWKKCLKPMWKQASQDPLHLAPRPVHPGRLLCFHRHFCSQPDFFHRHAT